MKQVGFVGAGNMGSAIIRGVLADGFLKPSQIMICDSNRRRLDELGKELQGVTCTADALELATLSDMIILAVKPQYIADVIGTMRPALRCKSLVSIAAGWTVSRLADALEGTEAGYLRVMPNTPAMVGEGMTAICDDSNFSHEDFAFAKGIFDAVGRTVVLPERLFDGVVAISGSSPAYVFMMIEAMADAGVREGIPRATAYEMAAQSVLGAALMVLSSDTHPGALKDAVCSPGGTTIDAVAALEKAGFRNAVFEGMKVCAEKSRQMSR